MGSPSLFSIHLRELASQGYIVFAIDHLDGSCGYTELKDGTAKPFNTQPDFYDFDTRKSQVVIR